MKSLPQPFGVQCKSESSRYYGSSSIWIDVMPYSTLNWQLTASKYGIEIPEIVDKTMGKSVCRQCKATYAGNQPACTAEVWFHKRGYSEVYGYDGSYSSNIKKECGYHLEWDLNQDFSLQHEFFSLLNKISSLPDIKHDPIYKFSQSFPPGVADHLRLRLLEKDLVEAVSNIQSALSQIASKMNNAGACLSFSF